MGMLRISSGDEKNPNFLRNLGFRADKENDLSFEVSAEIGDFRSEGGDET